MPVLLAHEDLNLGPPSVVSGPGAQENRRPPACKVGYKGVENVLGRRKPLRRKGKRSLSLLISWRRYRRFLEVSRPGDGLEPPQGRRCRAQGDNRFRKTVRGLQVPWGDADRRRAGTTVPTGVGAVVHRRPPHAAQATCGPTGERSRRRTDQLPARPCSLPPAPSRTGSQPAINLRSIVQAALEACLSRVR